MNLTDSFTSSVPLIIMQAQCMICFQLSAVEKYGLPSRIRCDQGRDNIHVARHNMLRYQGEERRLVLVGSSVHNQRIEGLWRDMHRCVTSLYKRLFYYLEHTEFLNPIDNIHVFSLQQSIARILSKNGTIMVYKLNTDRLLTNRDPCNCEIQGWQLWIFLMLYLKYMVLTMTSEFYLMMMNKEWRFLQQIQTLHRSKLQVSQ